MELILFDLPLKFTFKGKLFILWISCKVGELLAEFEKFYV